MDVAKAWNDLDRRLLTVLCIAVVVHAAMLVYDGYHAEIFLSADRAPMRWKDVVGVLAAAADGRLEAFLASHGVVGDYGLHALAYAVGGRAAVLGSQVILTLLAAPAVYRIACCCGLTRSMAVAAAALYLAFPHTMVLPHQLATEGYFTPLLVFSTWALVEASASVRTPLLFAILGGVLLGIATLIRPITLLWPFLVASLLIVVGTKRLAIAFAGGALLPVVAWAAFIYGATGVWGLGESNHSLGRNLYMRASKVTATMQGDAKADARARYLVEGPKGSLSPAEYLAFAAENPVPLAKQFARDAAVYLSKSGVERLTIDYLDMRIKDKSGFQDYDTGWRKRLDNDGFAATFRYLLDAMGPMLLLLSAFGAVFMVGVSTMAIWGAVSLYVAMNREQAQNWLASTVVCLLPIYTIVFSQVVPAVSSRHRAPAEFAFAILAAAGAAAVIKWWRQRNSKA